MKTPQALAALAAVNLALVAWSIAVQLRPAFADATPSVLRAHALQIVDGHGRVRASIEVLPAATTAAGEEQAETVLLRLVTERGRPSVKIGASETASGLSLSGPTGTSDTYAILQAKGTVTSLKLRNEDRRERVVEP